MIQIYTMQKALFEHPKDTSINCLVEAYSFEYVPDWVPDTLLFRLLSNSGKAKIIGSAKDVANVEAVDGKLDKKKVIENIEAADVVEEVDEPEIGETVKALETMKTKELYELCKQKGIECEEKKPKSYYLGLLAQ